MCKPKEKPVLFKPFLIDSIVHGNQFDAGDGQGNIVHFKRQTRRNHRLGDVGDLLWVKEQTVVSGDKVFYRRDNNFSCGDLRSWKSPLFMPKKYARVWLEITGVRQELLKNISLEDCFKEGIVIFTSPIFSLKISQTLYGWRGSNEYENEFNPAHNTFSAKEAFFDLIRFINGNKAYYKNNMLEQMVWVHDFKVVNYGN